MILPRIMLSMLLAVGVASTVIAGAEIRVDAKFPAGNIIVERVESNTVFVAPDLRDAQKGQWWFYWNFRLKAPPEKPVTIVFTEKNPIGVRGPAVSTDAGVTWRWLGAAAVKLIRHDNKPAWSFEARVPAGTKDVRYAFCPQYLESHLRSWLAQHQRRDRRLRVEELCRSRKGRSVELLRIGEPTKPIVLLTSRHHCCETMATYAMEGLLEAALADKRWRANWQIMAVPFMDKDGCEEGDQGKNRAPHDHNRDYNEQPVYPEVAALMKLGASLQGRVVAVLDMHCPWIRGAWNDRVYFVGAADGDFWQKQQAFAATLARVRQGPIRFLASDCLPFGTAWNKQDNYRQGRSNSAWARATFPDAQLVTSMEIAYAEALGTEVNADSARRLGRDLAHALAEYFVPSKP